MNEKRFGVMLDMSRNGVMKPAVVKRFVDYISSFGYNMLQLYTEDTYQVNGEPYFGYLRGGYKKDEIKEIDAYCTDKGVELVPCIQTLAHLSTIFKWFAYNEINDTADILLIDEPRTYRLIENIFATLAECFTSRKVHIGMDEAHMVGLGKYKDKYGCSDRFGLLSKHLGKVAEIAAKYGFKPMMWSDMFFRISNGGEYYGRNVKLNKDVAQSLPDVSLVYWDYYHTDKTDYSAMIRAHENFGKEIWFAGGAWSWFGFAPSNRYTIETMKPAMDACRECGVENIFLTLWGDNGKECSYFALLPSLFFVKRYYDGVTDVKQMAKEFEELTGEPFGRMIDTDLPNLVGGNREGFRNPSKYMLYSDPFFGFLDTQVKDGVDKEYKRLAGKFAAYASKSEKFGYIYDVLAKLCRVLTYKYDLGVRVRRAYREKNKTILKEAATDFGKTEKAVEAFHKSLSVLWHTENEPHGFEVQDLRLGGLIQRLKTCRKRLERYLDGEESFLPELEEELLDFWGNGKEFCKDTPSYPDWSMIVTANQLR